MTQVQAGELLKRLRYASARRQKAIEAEDNYRTAIDQMVLEGHAAKVPKTQLAEAAGLTRQTIYTIILKGERT